MKARKGSTSRVKTPDEWPWMYHEILVTLKPGMRVYMLEVHSPEEVERQMAEFRALLKKLPEYPMHPTSRWLAAHEKCNYNTFNHNSSLVTWQLVVEATPDYKKDLTNFLKTFTNSR